MKVATMNELKIKTLEAIDDILILTGIMKSDRAELEYEKRLSRILYDKWRRSTKVAIDDILENGDIEDFEETDASLDFSLGENFHNDSDVQSAIQKHIKEAYKKCREKFTRTSLSLPDMRAINAIKTNSLYWIREFYGKNLRNKIRDLTTEALELGLGRKALAEKMKNALSNDVGGGNYKYWEVVSSAALVRSRSFGAVFGLDAAGIASYEVIAMGDERMCKICGAMNGRVFDVHETVRQINGIINLTSPEEFKAAMPWHTSEPKGISGELAKKGMNLPPFHGKCRCIVAATELTQDRFDRYEIFDKVKTTEELQELIIKEWRLESADLSDLNVSLMKDVLKAYDEFDRLNPDFKIVEKLSAVEKMDVHAKGIASIKTENARLGQKYVLRFNPQAFSMAPEELGKFIKLAYDKGRITSTTSAGILIHEAGHMVEYGRYGRTLKSTWANNVIKEAMKTIKENSITTFKASISQYAADGGNRETIAEAIADVYSNGNKAKPASKAITDYLGVKFG